MMVDWIWLSLLPTGPAWCCMKRECQPVETINSMIERDQPKPQRSNDRAKVSLVSLFCRFQFLCPFSFRFNSDLQIGVYGKRQTWDSSFEVEIKLVTVKCFTCTNYTAHRQVVRSQTLAAQWFFCSHNVTFELWRFMFEFYNQLLDMLIAAHYKRQLEGPKLLSASDTFRWSSQYIVDQYFRFIE